MACCYPYPFPLQAGAPSLEGLLDLFDRGLFTFGNLRSRGDDFRSDAVFVFLEVFDELFCQLAGLFIVGFRIFPGAPGVEDFFRNIGTGFGNLESENRVGFQLYFFQAAVQNGVDHGAGMRDRHPVADAVRSTRPAGIDQPAVDLVLGDFFRPAGWRRPTDAEP